MNPIDFDPNEEKSGGPFDPRNYTPQELDVIEKVLRLMPRAAGGWAAGGWAAGSVGEITGGIVHAEPEST